jgi:magnesium chelatase family protein
VLEDVGEQVEVLAHGGERSRRRASEEWTRSSRPGFVDMLARIASATPWGIEAQPVEVEVDVQTGLPQIQIVGLPDAAVRESRERVRSALRNCGFDLPPRAVTVNLAPADARKEGNHLDLAIALALLAAHGAVPPEHLAGRLVIGELGLDGGVRPIRGALAIADSAAALGCRQLVLPRANAGEAAALEKIDAVGVPSLLDTVAHLSGERPIEPARHVEDDLPGADPTTDLAQVRGQAVAKRALGCAPRAATTCSSSDRRAPGRPSSLAVCRGSCRRSTAPKRWR